MIPNLRVWVWCLVPVHECPGCLSLGFCNRGCFLVRLSPGVQVPMGRRDCSGPVSPQIQNQAAKKTLCVLRICNVFPHVSILIFTPFSTQRSDLRAERVILKIFFFY